MNDPEEFPLRISAAIDRLEGVVEENERTIKSAISGLRSLVLEHYAAVQSRLDWHARRIQRLEDGAGLPPMAP